MQHVWSFALVLLGVTLVGLPAYAVTGSGDSATAGLETVKPTLAGITVPTGSSIEATFSEAMQATGLTTPGNYVLSGTGKGTLGANPGSANGIGPVTLTWSTGEGLGGAPLGLTVAGVQDALGNPIDTAFNTATGNGVGVAPVFSGLTVTPSSAAAGETVSIAFSSSEDLDGDAGVEVNGNPATRTAKATFTYSYTVLPTDSLGPVAMYITGFDLAGNVGTLNEPDALEVVLPAAALPLRTWPAALALLIVGALALALRRRKASALLLLALLAAPMAMGATPTVTNVSFVQTPTVSNTQVVITYDLVSPNGPSNITVALSKNGGGDGFSFPVTSVTGDLTGVTTGTGKQIIWNIATDYPNENIPNARLRVTADDNVIQTYTLTYTAGANGTISGATPQTVNSGGSGTAVTAVGGTLLHVTYAFTSWSDGVLSATRTDTNVLANKSVTANFQQSGCESGWGNCDGNLVNGCETDVNLSTIHCGTCGHTCAPGQICASGDCAWTLTYAAGAAGTINGTTSQTVVTGGNGTAVTAVSNSGFSFVNWSDGVLTATRTDANVTANLSVTANFANAQVTMISVAGSSFSMGRTSSGDDATYGGSDELPVHTVTLSAYQIGKYEVTNQQYCAVLNYAIDPSRNYLKDSTGAVWTGTGDIYAGGDLQKILWITNAVCNIQFSAGSFSPKVRVGLPGSTTYSTGTHPVVLVAWYGSVMFCNWFSEMGGLTPVYDASTAGWPANFANNGYHLPTEAQWERAAAWDGSKHWIYGFTSDTLTGKNRANYYDGLPDYMNPLGLTTTPYTSPVGWFNAVSVSPNGTVTTLNSVSPAGCYDMSGNVLEWCHDWYDSAYYSTSPGTDPLGAASGTVRSNRGGTWEISGSDYFRTAKRVPRTPDAAGFGVGFRLAK